MGLVEAVYKEFGSLARQVYALEAARLSFMEHYWIAAFRVLLIHSETV